jgi:hypothetical protein
MDHASNNLKINFLFIWSCVETESWRYNHQISSGRNDTNYGQNMKL